MRSIALGVLLGLCAACTGSATTATRSGAAESASAQAKQLPGQYTCSFESRGETLDDATCGIQPEGDALRLDMSGGAHQLRGTLTPTDAGFRFAGEYTCDQGEACNETVDTEFFQQSHGKYQGMVTLQTGSLLSVTLSRR
jgi:hypothetical protein